MKENVFELLRGKTYPGRGIVIGKSALGNTVYVIYFIMGRSENSRNRIFTYTGDGIRTEAYDPALMKDPSLIIYHPVRMVGDKIVVTNGDQTDTIRDFLLKDGNFRQALNTRQFEPDTPNYTPRISGIVYHDGSYSLSILKSCEGDPSSCQRFLFDYADPLPGEGRFISTYEDDGDPLPSFRGEPRRIGISGSLDDFANGVWNALNEDNKVSLYGCELNLETGTVQQLILNKHE